MGRAELLSCIGLTLIVFFVVLLTMVGQVYIILIFHYSATKRTARIGIPYFLSVELKDVDAAPLNLKLSIAPPLPVVPVQYKKNLLSYL